MTERSGEVARVAAPPSADAVEGPNISALSVLRIRSFGWMLGDSAFGAMGFQTITMAQAWVVLELTDSDAWVGIVNGLPAIPAAALVLFGGVMADRLDRRSILIWMRVVMASLGFATGVLVAWGVIEVWHLILLATAFSISRVFAMIVSQTLVVDIVGRERLFVGNAVFGTTFNFATFAGPAIGGILIASAGADFAYFAAGSMIALAIVFAMMIRLPARTTARRDTSVGRDLRDGLRYIGGTPELRWLAAMGLFLMFIGMYFPLVPRIARDSLGVGADGYGSILAAQGLGTFAGSATLLASGNIRSIGRILVASSVVFSLLLVGFAFVTTLLLAWLVAFGIGAVIPWWSNTMRTAFQLPTSEEMRGRVMGLFALAGQAIVFGWIVGGVASELIGPRATLISGGAITATFYLFAYARSGDLRRLGSD